MSYDERNDVTNPADDHEHIVLSLEETEPVELEEVEMPSNYLHFAAQHVGAKLTRWKPDPEKGKGGG